MIPSSFPFVRRIAVITALAGSAGCDITETGLTCIPMCVNICDAPSEAAFFSAEVVATGEDGRVRLVERLGGTAELDLAPGDEIAHGSLAPDLTPGDPVIVTVARGASGEPEVVAGVFPLDAAGENVLCSKSNPQDPRIPLPVDDYMSLAGADQECRADLDGRGIPIECEDTP